MDDVAQRNADIIETAKKRYREAISAWGDLRDEMLMPHIRRVWDENIAGVRR